VRKRADLETQIDECRKSLDNRKSVLVTVDEWDRQVEGQQVFEMFHGPLEWNESQGKEVIWIFIASGKTKEDLVQLINNSPKGTDVYRRLGNEKEYQLIIPALTAGDKVIIGAAKALDFKFVRAEATALMTIALDPSLDSCGAIEKRIRDIHRSNSGTKLLLKDHFLEVSELTQFYKRYEQIFTQLDKVIDIMVRLA